MLKIRLQRVGRKHEPLFRLVLTDSQNGPRSGKFLEILGSFDARNEKAEIKADRVQYWHSKGAQFSPTMNNLLIDKGVIKGEKISVLPKKVIETEKQKKIDAAKAAEEAKKAEAEAKKQAEADAKAAEEAKAADAPASAESPEAPASESAEEAAPQE
jgi:small subunit ribosomal protein S16